MTDQKRNSEVNRRKRRVEELEQIHSESSTRSPMRKHQTNLGNFKIKSPCESLYYQVPENDELPTGCSSSREFLINLFCTPGHVDHSYEVSTALRVTDGALVVVDTVECGGSYTQLEPSLRMMVAERIKPILFMNKVDRFILELRSTPLEMYHSFQKLIGSINSALESLKDSRLGDISVSPEKGTVVFGSGLDGWAFTLDSFAKLYAAKFGVPQDKLVKKLWGDQYFDSETKKWDTSNISALGKQLNHSFCQFVLEPIYRLIDCIMEGDKDKITKILESIGISLTIEELKLSGKQLYQVTMQKFLPLDQALLGTMVCFLPSPIVAQKYRVECLYEGSLDDECAVAIRDCNPNGPLMMYISKMIPCQDRGRFYAFGRVFSGVVDIKQKVRIMGPKYVPGKKEDLFLKSIQRVILLLGSKPDIIDDCPCGNIICLVGIDQFLVNTGTITTSEIAHNFRSMKFSTSPIVKISVEPKNPADLPKLVEGLKRLSKADPTILCITEESGEHVVAGPDELHLEISIRDLAEYHAGIEIKTSDPFVQFRESVLSESSITCLAKTPNKLTRFFCKAEPLPMDLQDEIEFGDISLKDGDKVRANYLTDKYQWDINDGKNIWSFGPESIGANILVNQTKGVQYLNEVRDPIVKAFQWATKEGAICEEPTRGIRFNLLDVTLSHTDPIRRGSSQIIPATRRVLYASQLSANPILLEPIYLVDIIAPQSNTIKEDILSVLNRRRGVIISEENYITGSSITNIKAYTPVLESFGLKADLLCHTKSEIISISSLFSHWSSIGVVGQSPKSTEIAIMIRKRKYLPENIPNLDKYLDKL
eukprot:gene4842-6033_t